MDRFLDSSVLTQEDPVSEITDSASAMWEGFLESLPRVGVALLVVAFGWVVSRVVRRFLENASVIGSN